MKQADADGRTERASPSGDTPPPTGQIPAAPAPFDHDLRFGEMTAESDPAEMQARSLEANAMLLRSILETMPEALVVIDISGEVLLFSKAAEAMFGYAASEVVGHNVSILMPELAREQHDAYMSRFRSTGQSAMIGRARRLIGRRKDGSEFPHSLQIAEAFGGGGHMIAGFMQDLSAAEASALQVEQLQRELAHIGRAHEMGTLASTIAHELNQPLMAIANIVQTAADLLKRGDPAMREPIIKALDDAGQETLRAGEILRRLRDFLSRGELEKTFEDACKLAEDAISFESALARYRNIHCKIECAPDLTPILVDRVQIQQVILNLVKNAVQSIGQNGTVRIAITPANTMVRFTVSDTGPGVPPARIGRLFDPFSTTKTEGMGLGLPICRSIIEAHGGMIWYETAPGGGAAFIFTIPLFQEESDDAQ
ncbi:MAG: PAS domain-containing sensor histidine kinase [Porphyrobacter sp.]|jgi:two-component system sensor kinase FixL|nr:PAS domain-containing sensor histidine kinase [Porphyrobacter sp.]